jgi:hypothetical protein
MRLIYRTSTTRRRVYSRPLPCGQGGNRREWMKTITWSLPEGSPWKEGEPPDGWFYYCHPVRSGEKITLVLRGCLDEDAADGSYEVKLKAESVQTTHGAAEEIWPNWPGEQ